MNRSRRRRGELLVLLGALSALGPAAIDMYVPALPRIADDLGAATASTQLTLTTFLVGLGAGQVVAGPLSDVLGRRRPLLAGIAVYVAAAGACALAPSVAVLAAARFVQGIAAAAGIVIARAVVRDLYSGAALARTYSRIYLIVGGAPIFAPVIGTQLLRVASWRGIFLVLGTFGAALLVLAALRLPETLARERRTRGSVGATFATFRTLVRHRNLVGYAVTVGCGTAALVATASGAPFVVQDLYGESPQVYGVLVLVGGLAVVVANQVNAVLVPSVGARRLLLGGFAGDLAAAVALLTAGGRGLAPFVVCFVALFAAYGFIVANATALALREHAAVAGAAAAFVGLVQYGMGALAAPLSGVAGGTRVVPLGVVVAGFALAGFAGAALAARRGRPVERVAPASTLR